ncbi:tRNA (adenosine(37)-N6)-dimethylallyltransferase MiaA [Propionimicrobium sp. PCR01-08-3]|uniref:tRNA (adenosine(37)-N6)-dimethylallyltransferase MiaA n=1 Tax=Propionimicrobium sp. PCR01-08-3 TaxID=3052086 RepID=UPI00255CFBCA|nr:tRNA (adenosine(37)-N6)-dimethylallyltransferase MiaA [Propionimicrobium sp. PCR01-08-3]WIY83649.1 tRNA (adenosine(37)-N6)-dimethylallyltransferase MiaA [Propionimicrobium sp. PCR01-08-3]
MTGLPLVVLIGPTASGKSSLAIRLAELLAARGQPAEIVNADSMLVYRGMNIGTAKPTPDELARVRHHLVDIMDVTKSASVAEFQLMARQAISELRARDIVPILVGGSSLYIRAIVDNFDFPGTDPAIRAKWQAELDRIGAPALHRILAERQPEAAASILPGNGRRIVRALEVIELTGDFRPRLPEPSYALDDVRQFGLRIERSEMDARIAARVDQMWAAGLVDEVRRLVAQGLRSGVTASRGLGYQQVLDYLDGEITEDQAREQTIAGTKRFARKQLGWFTRDPRISWLDALGSGLAETIVDELGFAAGR